MVSNTQAADSTSTAYIPYFDKETMLQLAAEENGQRVYELLAASKHQASACLDSIPSLQGISEAVLVQITLQLLEKGWHLRIFTWLHRVLDEVPNSLSTILIAIASSDYWTLNEEGQEDEKFKRKRDIFCARYDVLFSDFVTKVEKSGIWDTKLERAYGLYLRHILREDMSAARAFRSGFEDDGDIGAIVPYAQILLDKKHFEAAKNVLKMGWDKHKDIACLKSLTQLHFLTKNSKEAIPMYFYLQSLGYPIEAPLGTLLRDYQFPRDFNAIEALGASGADHYLGAAYKKDLFQAISDGMNTFDSENPDAIEYELRSVRLAAIEFRNYTASLQFVTQIMELYEGGWEKRAVLKNFFEKHPLPRVKTFLLEDEGDEQDEGVEVIDIPDNFEDILSAHLYLAARFAITPERLNLIETLKDFATEYKLEKLTPLMTDLTLVHERISRFFDGMGAEFASFYVEMQRAAISALHGEENYFAVLLAVLEGKCDLNSNTFLDYGNLVAFTSAAIVYGADSEYTESMIEQINLDFMPAAAIKQFAQLLRNGGYERYALGAIARGDLQDLDILSSLLSVTFSGVHAPEDMVVALTARPDFDTEFPVDIRKILADKLQTEKLPNGLYNADIMTLLGEAFIAYGEIRNGLSLLRQSALTGNLRARTRIAEYYLYQNPKPAKALKLFEEIYTITKDPKFLADIARAKQLLMEQQAIKLQNEEIYDSSKLLELIKDLPQSHPDYLCTFLELSVRGNEEVFEKACRVLMFSHPSDLNSLPEDVFEQYDIRMIVEIDRIEGMKHVEWKDMAKHLFYARTLAGVHQDDIEYTLDYFYDMLTYLEDFQTVAPKGASEKEHLKETVSLRNGVFTHFLRQFSSLTPEELEEQILTLVEYDEQGQEIGFFDQLVDPFAIALIYEVGYFEQMFVYEKKLPKFYEIVAEIFESICEHPILAERYEQRGRKILEYQKQAKKSKKFVDTAVQNSPTLLQ